MATCASTSRTCPRCATGPGPPELHVLVVNAGSSSLKLSVLGPGEEMLAADHVREPPESDAARRRLDAFLRRAPGADAVGHRVVHGGPDLTEATVLDADVERRLDELADLAPLHNPPAVAAIRAVDRLVPDLPAVACFDTAFHATLPAEAATYALPAAWRDRWPLRRFGFHGLSHAYAARRAAELLGRDPAALRVVTAHLGAGASLAAVHGGRSVDTTMGFTPLEGLVMATRSGSVDPGLLLWVQRHGDLTAAEAEHALDRESGLLGLSGGRSGDMRDIVAGADAGDERCRLALGVYVHRLAGAVATMATSLGGLDALAFTGGVGEQAAAVRARVAERLAWLGVALDADANAHADGDALIGSGRVAAVVVTAREDIEIARHVRRALRTG